MAEKRASGCNFGGQDRQGMAVTEDAVAAWFVREILPLEANLVHYLRHNWRNASDIPDLRQEIYARVFEAARERIPDNPKHFLLVCARNHLINIVRRDQVVAIETFADVETFDIASDEPNPDRVVIAKDEIRRLQAAIETLPPRTRQAITLAYFEGLSATEVAKRMGIARPTASRAIAHGALILAEILYGTRRSRGTDS